MSYKKIFVTSTGRTGSKFMFSLLKEFGLQLGAHEQYVGPEGGVITFTWNKDTTIEHFVPEPIKDWNQVALVREPLACILSLTTVKFHSGPQEFRFLETPEVRGCRDVLKRSMIFYYQVNNWLFELWQKNNIQGFIRLEDVGDRKTLSKIVELTHTDLDTNNVEISSADFNSKVEKLQNSYNFLDKKYEKKLNTRLDNNKYLYNNDIVTWETMNDIDTDLTNDIKSLSKKIGYEIL